MDEKQTSKKMSAGMLTFAAVEKRASSDSKKSCLNGTPHACNEMREQRTARRMLNEVHVRTWLRVQAPQSRHATTAMAGARWIATAPHLALREVRSHDIERRNSFTTNN